MALNEVTVFWGSFVDMVFGSLFSLFIEKSKKKYLNIFAVGKTVTANGIILESFKSISQF